MFRSVHIPSLGRSLSCFMANPSSAHPDTHEASLDEYRRLGGNCIYMHGEGGETHSRMASGRWLRDRGLGSEFFLCMRICHDEWDQANDRPIDRFTADAVAEDVTRDLDLIGVDRINLVALSDKPLSPLEPVIDAIAREIKTGRVGAFGLNGWSAQRIEQANAYAHRLGISMSAAIFTTEFALARATESLWPEYPPFAGALEQTLRHGGSALFAHVEDFNLGQCLFDDADAVTRPGHRWITRWNHPENHSLVRRVREFAAARNLTTRQVSLAYVLNQPFPVVGIIGLPSLLTDRRHQYDRASQLRLTHNELTELQRGRKGD